MQPQQQMLQGLHGSEGSGDRTRTTSSPTIQRRRRRVRGYPPGRDEWKQEQHHQRKLRHHFRHEYYDRTGVSSEGAAALSSVTRECHRGRSPSPAAQEAVRISPFLDADLKMLQTQGDAIAGLAVGELRPQRYSNYKPFKVTAGKITFT